MSKFLICHLHVTVSAGVIAVAFVVPVMLAVLGLRHEKLREATRSPAPVGRFTRVGEARAGRLTASRIWTTTAGDTLNAEAGDWWVVSGDRKKPDVRSVKPEAFARTYELIEGNRYQRTGEVQARQVLEAETVQTSEGLVKARVHDWIVTDEAGARWPVPADRFGDLYKPVLRMYERNSGSSTSIASERRCSVGPNNTLKV